MSHETRDASALENDHSDLGLEEDLLVEGATDDLDREGTAPMLGLDTESIPIIEGESIDDEGPILTAPKQEARLSFPDPRERPPQRSEVTSWSENSEKRTTSKKSEKENREGCAIIGPSQVGKTSLLLAIETACTLVERNQPELRFIPTGQTPKLIRTAIRVLKGETVLKGSTEHAEYEFTIQVGQHDLLMRVEDGPGGALFPDEGREKRADGTEVALADPNFKRWEETMVDKVSSSRHLILCVDASNPRSDLWRTFLPRLVGKLIDRQAPRASPPAVLRMPTSAPLAPPQKWWEHFRRIFPGAAKSNTPRLEPTLPEHGLQFERVLVLLTKMDKFVATALAELRKARRWLEDEQRNRTWKMEPSYRSLVQLSELNPEELLMRLDPVDQAVEILGPSLLQRVRSAISLQATIGVGLSSAGGFKKNGQPFFSRDGGPDILPGIGQEDVLRHWVPCGIREAMLFMATGEPNRLVSILTRQHIDRERQDEAIHIASSDHGRV